MSELNGRINAALIFIDRALDELSDDVCCEWCGNEIDFSESTIVENVQAAKDELLRMIKGISASEV